MEIKATRNVNPWVLLWSRCKWAYNESLSGDVQEPYLLFSMLLCAFSLEAFMNHLLRIYYPGDWESYERHKSPSEKLDKLAELLNFEVDKGRRPFQTFNSIFDFRNDIVHAKTIKLEESFSYPIDKFLKAEEIPPVPLTKWEKSLTSKDAKKFIDDSEKIILIMHDEANLGDDPFDRAYSKTSFKGSL